MLGGVALVGGSAIWTACAKERAPGSATSDSVGAFARDDVAYLDEIADTILPDTDKSPGARAARVGAFMALMVTDCYELKDQAIFRTGLTQLNDACQKAHRIWRIVVIRATKRPSAQRVRSSVRASQAAQGICGIRIGEGLMVPQKSARVSSDALL